MGTGHQTKNAIFSCCFSLFFGLLVVGCGGETDNGADLQFSSDPQFMENQVVEAACGQCQFGMAGEGCDLAIRYQGSCYLVIGSGIDDHGDAHANDGLCNCVRKAKVSGTMSEGKFHADKIRLLEIPLVSD